MPAPHPTPSSYPQGSPGPLHHETQIHPHRPPRGARLLRPPGTGTHPGHPGAAASERVGGVLPLVSAGQGVGRTYWGEGGGTGDTGRAPLTPPSLPQQLACLPGSFCPQRGPQPALPLCAHLPAARPALAFPGKPPSQEGAPSSRSDTPVTPSLFRQLMTLCPDTTNASQALWEIWLSTGGERGAGAGLPHQGALQTPAHSHCPLAHRRALVPHCAGDWLGFHPSWR